MGFVTNADFEDCKQMGIETKAEYDSFKASGDLDECKQLGIETKVVYDSFKASPDYEECKMMQIETKPEYDSFKASPDYEECKQMGIETKPEYDSFKATVVKFISSSFDSTWTEDDMNNAARPQLHDNDGNEIKGASQAMADWEAKEAEVRLQELWKLLNGMGVGNFLNPFDMGNEGRRREAA